MSQLSQWQSKHYNSFLVHLRKPLYRNGYALIFNATSTSIFGVLYWILAARYYRVEAVGLNAVAIASMNFLASVSRLYLDGVLIRFLPRSGANAGRLIRYSYFVGGAAAALFGLIFILGLNFWAPALRSFYSSPLLAVGFVVATIASCIFVQQDGVLTGLRQAKWVPVENLLFALAKLLLLITLAKPLPGYGIFASWAIPLVISLLPVNLLIFRKLIPKHIQENSEPESGIGTKHIVHYAGGLYAGYLFSTASSQLLPLIVLQVAGSRAAAFFTLPWMIISSLQAVIPSMMGSLVVEASRDQTKLIVYSRQAFAQIARIMVPVIVILFAFAPYLLSLFGQIYAAEAALLLRLLSVASLAQIVTGLFLGIARVKRFVKGVISVHASLFVLILSLSYFFLAEFGITGVGFAWLLSQMVVALVLFFTHLRPIIWSNSYLATANTPDNE